MTGETNLTTLLTTMQPELHEAAYVFCSVSQADYARLTVEPLGVFREAEGITLIIEQAQAVAHGLPFQGVWACITLTVHSSLAAVGFMAAISGRLAQAGLSVNPVAGYYHDHLFVPWTRREEALAILKALSDSIHSAHG